MFPWLSASVVAYGDSPTSTSLSLPFPDAGGECNGFRLLVILGQCFIFCLWLPAHVYILFWNTKNAHIIRLYKKKKMTHSLKEYDQSTKNHQKKEMGKDRQTSNSHKLLPRFHPSRFALLSSFSVVHSYSLSSMSFCGSTCKTFISTTPPFVPRCACGDTHLPYFFCNSQ